MSSREKIKKMVSRVEIPGIGMGGKYRSMHFIRHSNKSKSSSYVGVKKTRMFNEENPSQAAKSVRRHEESKHKRLEKRSKKAGFYVHGHKNFGDVYED